MIIITEDSISQLPEIRRWKDTLGKGDSIENNIEITSRLRNQGLPLPANNINDEAHYRELLSDFIRPADRMFAGPFLEVKTFREMLNQTTPTDLFVISGRYGLLSADTPIIPYKFPVDSREDLFTLDSTSHVSKKIVEVSNDADLIIFALSSVYLRYFFSSGLFQKLNPNLPKIIVGATRLGDELPECPLITFFPRKGVARLGKLNQKSILSFIKNFKKCIS